MSDLNEFRKMVYKNSEAILRAGKPRNFDTLKKLTRDEGFRTEVKRYADKTILMIDKDINEEDYKVASAMIRGVVDVGLLYLMGKYDLQFMEKK